MYLLSVYQVQQILEVVPENLTEVPVSMDASNIYFRKYFFLQTTVEESPTGIQELTISQHAEVSIANNWCIRLHYL